MIPIVVARQAPAQEINTDIPRSDALRHSDVSRYGSAPDPIRQTENAAQFSRFGVRAPWNRLYESFYPWYYSQSWHPFVRKVFGPKVPIKLGASQARFKFTAYNGESPIDRGDPVPYGSTVPQIGRRR